MKKRKTSRRFEKLNPMRRRLLKEISKGKNIGQAALAAGYSHPQGGNNAIQQMRPRIMAALEKQGWSIEDFVEKHLVPLLQAKKTLYFSDHGIVTDKRIVNDNAIRLATGDQYLKVVGGYAPVSVEHTGAIVHVLTEQERREARESIEKIIAYSSESETPLLAEVIEDPKPMRKAKQ